MAETIVYSIEQGNDRAANDLIRFMVDQKNVTHVEELFDALASVATKHRKQLENPLEKEEVILGPDCHIADPRIIYMTDDVGNLLHDEHDQPRIARWELY